MTANPPYDPLSLMRFQLSVLSLEAALDRSAPAKQAATGALVEAEKLKDLVERVSS